MQHYKMHWRKFITEFSIDMSPDARFKKLIIEVVELIEAERNGTLAEMIDEALDVMVCAIALVISLGVMNPLNACARKLERTAEKYRKQGGEDPSPPITK
jgi:NTP pyrophosphatase (non-canonical NTP hydrolase)